MRPSPGLLVGCALALFGCSKERSEIAPPVAAPVASPAAAPVAVKAAAPSASAGGDEALRLCGQKSLCPNEPVDDEGTMLCASIAREPICGAKFLALVRCQVDKEKCGPDGKIDQVATLDLCKVEETALHECDKAKAAAAKASGK